MKKIYLFLVVIVSGFSVASANYVETSVGYLIDSKEPVYSVRAGFALLEEDWASHIIEFEVGFFDDEESIPGLSASLEFIPLMINYRGVFPINGGFSYYVGVGAGVSFIDFDSTPSFLPWYDTADTAFTYHGSLGLSYAFSENASAILGYRHIEFLDVFNAMDLNEDIVEFGLSFAF